MAMAVALRRNECRQPPTPHRPSPQRERGQRRAKTIKSNQKSVMGKTDPDRGQGSTRGTERRQPGRPPIEEANAIKTPRPIQGELENTSSASPAPHAVAGEKHQLFPGLWPNDDW